MSIFGRAEDQYYDYDRYLRSIEIEHDEDDDECECDECQEA